MFCDSVAYSRVNSHTEHWVFGAEQRMHEHVRVLSGYIRWRSGLADISNTDGGSGVDHDPLQACHALLTIMFKDVPLLFLVDPILQNTDKQSQLFGQAP